MGFPSILFLWEKMRMKWSLLSISCSSPETVAELLVLYYYFELMFALEHVLVL